MNSNHQNNASAGSRIESRTESTPRRLRFGVRRWVLVGGAAICAICWVALGIGIATDVSKGTLFVLAMLAAVATEGLFWVAAAVLGVTTFQARRRIWRWLSGRARTGPT